MGESLSGLPAADRGRRQQRLGAEHGLAADLPSVGTSRDDTVEHVGFGGHYRIT
jgi:hypothetical protein